MPHFKWCCLLKALEPRHPQLAFLGWNPLHNKEVYVPFQNFHGTSCLFLFFLSWLLLVSIGSWALQSSKPAISSWIFLHTVISLIQNLLSSSIILKGILRFCRVHQCNLVEAFISKSADQLLNSLCNLNSSLSSNISRNSDMNVL